MVESDASATNDNSGDSKSWFKRISFKELFMLGASGVFWVWQIALVVFSLFFLFPYVIPSMWMWYQHYSMPAHYFGLGLVLMLLPFVCLGMFYWLLTSERKPRMPLLLKFFYGFELPSVLLIGLFLLNLRDFGFGAYWFLLIALIALCVWFVFICCERIHGPVKDGVYFVSNPLAMVGSSVVFAVGLFVSVALSLFVIPIFASLIAEVFTLIAEFSFKEFWDALISIDWLELFFGLFQAEGIILIAAMFLFITSFLLFIALPVVLLFLYMQQFIARIMLRPSLVNAMIVVVVLGVLVGVHHRVNRQPQQAVFALLEKEAITDSDQHDMIGRLDDIREGLLNAYLSRYRYISSTGSAMSLTALYEEVFDLGEDVAHYPQQLFNAMFSPIIYDGANYQDSIEAAKLYSEIFDQPIQQAEYRAIWDTLRFNDESSAQNAAGVLDVNQEAVYLQKQQINVSVDDQLATIRITQKLVNHRTRILETVAHFSLPEFAVLTGVWLSDTEQNLEQNAGMVAPRGAAQEVYNAEVSRRIDPALLEKVGPELYRLRVYPIERATVDGASSLKPGKPMYVTFEYATLATKDGTWPLPKLLERRNLFWDTDTINELNGGALAASGDGGWIPDEVGRFKSIEPSITHIPATDERSVWAVPRAQVRADVLSLVNAIEDYVVLVDGSRSMHTLKQEVKAAVAEFANAQIYFCKLECKRTDVVDVSNQVYWGKTQPIQHLESFLAQRDQPDSEGIVILTDSAGYELADDAQAVVDSGVPVWVLHLNRAYPKAYADAWLTTVNRSGGDFLTGGPRELKTRLSILKNGVDVALEESKFADKNGLTLASVGSDWLWFDGPATSDSASGDALVKLGAAKAIQRMTKSGDVLGLEQLDELHVQALENRIVTELSSMLVLINDRQKEALKEASEKDDRFDRENENGEQAVGVPTDNLSVSAVPEPREWAMLVVVLLFATVSLYRRRQNNMVY